MTSSSAGPEGQLLIRASDPSPSPLAHGRQYGRGRHDPLRHDPLRHDPLCHDPLCHEPLRHDPLSHDIADWACAEGGPDHRGRVPSPRPAISSDLVVDWQLPLEADGAGPRDFWG